MSETHTGGEWRKGTLVQNDGSVAVMSDDGRVCRADTPDHAERIVLCCNAHDDLVAALKACIDSLVYPGLVGGCSAESRILQAESALAKAGEK